MTTTGMPASGAPKASVAFKDLRIMVVEDQDDTRVLLRKMLRSMGIVDLVETPDGRAALERLDLDDDRPFDVVICDWMMPEMSGLDLLREVRRRFPKMPFLMVTGKVDPAAVKSAAASGVSGYIAKPFSQAQIEAKLRILARHTAPAA